MCPKNRPYSLLLTIQARKEYSPLSGKKFPYSTMYILPYLTVLLPYSNCTVAVKIKFP